MSGAEYALIITSLATLVSAIGGIVVSLRNADKLQKVHDEVKVVASETNGMKDQLVKVTGEAEFAKGVKQERDRPHKK